MLSILLIFTVAWATEEGSQLLVRWRAQRLLADIDSISVNRSGWSDAQALMKKWGDLGAPAASCTAELCNYRVTLLQVLPRELIGYPDKGVKNWLPRIMDHIGLRSVAVRAGINVEHGVIMSKWFAEQVSLPVSAWGSAGNTYIPDLAISSGEYTRYPDYATKPSAYPYRRIQNFEGPYGITVYFMPQEEAGERAALMDFHLTCITRFSPCLSQGDILPEAWKMAQAP
jgi:hypothetical protein